MEPALLQWFPTKKLQHRRRTTFGVLHRWWWGYEISCICRFRRTPVIWCSANSTTLHCFDFINVTFGVRLPWRGRILQLWAYKIFLRHNIDFDWTFFVFLEIKARVVLAFLQILSTCSLNMSLESMVMPKYLADGTKLSTLPCIK